MNSEKKIIKLLPIFLLMCSISIAQNYEHGKVTIAELQQKTHPLDSSAPAAILFKVGTTRFDVVSDGDYSSFAIRTEVKFKIKIYKKEGLEYANHMVSFYTGGTVDEKVNYKDAVTYNLVNGKIEKTKLKSDGEFIEEKNEDFSIKKITMPQVKEGSIIEFTYEFNSPYITKIDDYFLQTEIPVDHVNYTIYIPEFYIYSAVISGFEQVNVEEKSVVETGHSSQKYVYTLNNVPAVKEEDFIINIDNYTSIIKYELVSISYPNQPTKKLAMTWQDVVKTIYEDPRFGDELLKEGYFNDELKNLMKGNEMDDEKIKIIFNYVKSKMNWNGKNGIYSKDGLRNAFKENIGNVAEINLILIAMLRRAGINANPILLSTRDNGIAYFPNRTAFNYVICGVDVEGKKILLDASDKNSTMNLIPLKAINWTGKLIRLDGSFDEINLQYPKNSRENIIITANIEQDGKIKGNCKRQITDYYAYSHRNRWKNATEDAYLESLENKHTGLIINEYDVSNINELDKPIIETSSFEYDNAVESIGNKLYLNPLLFYIQSENPFKSIARKYPIDFNFPIADTYNISYTIPDGYKVEFLPDPLAIQLENSGLLFKYKITHSENSIQVLVNFNINEFVLPASDFEGLKEFFKTIVEKQNEKIILIKK